MEITDELLKFADTKIRFSVENRTTVEDLQVTYLHTMHNWDE